MITCRFRAQIEICKLIRCLPNEETVATFGAVLIQELGCTSLQQSLHETFLQNRLRLSDESNKKLLSHLHATLDDTNNQTKCDDASSSLSRLESLPKDIFNRIGMYLNIFDCASRFSHCNHNIHKMVLNKEFIATPKQTRYRHRLVLTPKIIQKIMDNNTCSMFIYHGCEGASFKNVGQCDKISCCSRNPCVLCQFHTKIENAIASIDEKDGNNNSRNESEHRHKNAKSTMNQTNYNLLWYPKWLSKIRIISLDDDWPCLCQKLQFKWLLKPPSMTTSYRDNNKKDKPIINCDSNSHVVFFFVFLLFFVVCF